MILWIRSQKTWDFHNFSIYLHMNLFKGKQEKFFFLSRLFFSKQKRTHLWESWDSWKNDSGTQQNVNGNIKNFSEHFSKSSHFPVEWELEEKQKSVNKLFYSKTFWRRSKIIWMLFFSFPSHFSHKKIAHSNKLCFSERKLLCFSSYFSKRKKMRKRLID